MLSLLSVSPVGPILANSMLLHSLNFAWFPVSGLLLILHSSTIPGGPAIDCAFAPPRSHRGGARRGVKMARRVATP